MKWLDSIVNSLTRLFPDQQATLEKISSEEGLVQFLEKAEPSAPVDIQEVVNQVTTKVKAEQTTAVEALVASEAFTAAITQAVNNALPSSVEQAVNTAVEAITQSQATFTEAVNVQLAEMATKVGVKLTDTVLPKPETEILNPPPKPDEKSDKVKVDFNEFFPSAGKLKVADFVN